MTTATPTKPLDDVLRERWANGPKHSGSVFDDGRRDALDAVIQAMMGDYFQYDDSGEVEPVEPLAAGWLREVEGAALEMGIAAFEEHVVPIVAQAIRANLPLAPEYLRVYPGSETLRADLAALEGEDR